MSRRFYVPVLPEAGGLVTLPPEEAHHALSVLRLGEGAAVEVFDGSGRLAEAEVAHASRRAVEVRILSCTNPGLEPNAFTLATAVPKGKRWQMLVEKCTELGVGIIQPIRFGRSVGDGGAPEKWIRWAVEAAKQCNRLTLPTLCPVMPFTDWLRPPMTGWHLADREGSAPGLLPRPVRGILIGPEGGLTDAEQSACVAAGLGRVRLGRHILRIETAAVAACVVAGFDSTGADATGHGVSGGMEGQG